MNTIKKDPTRNTEESLNLMYQHIRSGEPPNLETAQKFIERMFFSPKRYDLGKVGRYRLNKQFDLDVPLDHTVLTTDDMIKVIEFLIEMRKGNRGSDDIDHLGNRRMKTVGEQLTHLKKRGPYSWYQEPIKEICLPTAIIMMEMDPCSKGAVKSR